MRIILALICFLAMMMHAFFGYFLYVRGETVFEPDNMIVAVQKKVAPNVNKLSIFEKKSDHIDDPVLKEQAKNASFFEKPNDGLVKTEEKTITEGAAPAPDLSEKAAAQIEEASSNQNPESNVPPAPEQNATQAEEPKTEYVPFNTGWSGFLQVENALITVLLFFLGFSICCVKGRGPASRWVFALNFLFWGTLAGAVYFFLPVNTPLVIFNMKFSFPQWWVVIGTSGLAAVLSFLLFLNAFRHPLTPQEIKAKKDAKKGAPESVPPVSEKPAEKPASSHRFSFGHKEAKPQEEVKKEPTIIVPPAPKSDSTPEMPDKRAE